MLSKPTVQALQGLAALSKQNHWRAIESLITEELNATLTRMIDTPDERDLRQLQGRAKLLKEIQQLVHNAPDELKRRGHTTSIM